MYCDVVNVCCMLVRYVDVVVAVTVMRVLLFVLDVCMLGCVSDGNAGVWDGRGVGGISAWHEYVGGTCGSGSVSNAADVLGMGVVREMRLKELVECVKCVCL